MTDLSSRMVVAAGWLTVALTGAAAGGVTAGVIGVLVRALVMKKRMTAIIAASAARYQASFTKDGSAVRREGRPMLLRISP